MRKYYEGYGASFPRYDATYYQELSADYHDCAKEEQMSGLYELAAESQHASAVFAAKARFLMGLQD